jgi:hypothetical protein
MRTGQPIIGRPAWHDRNPITTLYVYSAAGVAPHTTTPRWTYTVPSGKKAMIEFLHVRILRSAAATTAGKVTAAISITPSGGPSADIMVANILTNNVGDREALVSGATLTLLAGDKIAGYTSDASTGGTIDYVLACKATEFDA